MHGATRSSSLRLLLLCVFVGGVVVAGVRLTAQIQGPAIIVENAAPPGVFFTSPSGWPITMGSVEGNSQAYFTQASAGHQDSRAYWTVGGLTPGMTYDFFFTFAPVGTNPADMDAQATVMVEDLADPDAAIRGVVNEQTAPSITLSGDVRRWMRVGTMRVAGSSVRFTLVPGPLQPGSLGITAADAVAVVRSTAAAPSAPPPAAAQPPAQAAPRPSPIDLAAVVTGSSTVRRGLPTQFQIRVMNAGSERVSDVFVSFPITDPTFTMVPERSDQACVSNGTMVTCRGGPLAPGVSKSFGVSFSTVLPNPCIPVLSQPWQASVSTSVQEENTVNNTSTALIAVTCPPPPPPVPPAPAPLPWCTLLGSLTFDALPHGLSLKGTIAYVSTLGGLRIVDVSNPAAPVVVGSAPVPLAGPSAVQGNYLYMFGYTEGSSRFYVLDISTPSAPVILGSTVAGRTPKDITVSGRHAYVVNGDAFSFEIYDISVPSSPVSVATIGTAPFPVQMEIRGTLAYVVSLGNTGITTINTPAGPVQLPNGIGALQTFDVSVPSAPVLVSTTEPTPEVPYGGGWAMVLDGDRIITAMGPEEFSFFSLANPRVPVRTATGTALNIQRGIAVHGRYLVALSNQIVNNQSVKIYDMSALPTLRLVGQASTGLTPAELALDADRIYVLSWGSRTLQIFAQNCIPGG